MRFRSLLAAVSLTILLQPHNVFGDTLYKCEQNGVLVFSDQPCQGKQLGEELSEQAENLPQKQKGNALKRPGYADTTTQAFQRCSDGELAACQTLGITKPGQRWKESGRSSHTVTNGQQLSGKYARYPKETKIRIECLPSRRTAVLYLRQDLDSVFLKDGDMIVNSPNGLRGQKEYGSRFSSLEEAADAACR